MTDRDRRRRDRLRPASTCTPAATSGSARSCCASCRRRPAPTTSRSTSSAARTMPRPRRSTSAASRSPRSCRASGRWPGSRRCSSSPSSSPGRSGPSTRTAARRRATPRAIMPTGCGSRGSLSQGHAGARARIARPATSQPFVAVRDDSLQVLPHRHPRPCRPRAGCSARRPISAASAGSSRTSAPSSARPPGRCVDCHTEHEGPQEIPPTPQRFCADCHADIAVAAARHAGSPAPSDFEDGHPEFQPSVLIRWDGEQPQHAARRARPQRARGEQPQIPARASPRSARRRRADGAAAGGALRLRRQPAMRRLPRADARRHPLPAGRHGGGLRHVPQPRLRSARRHHPHPAPRLARAGDRRSARALPRRRPAAAGGAERRRARSGPATSTRSAPRSSSPGRRRASRCAPTRRSAPSSRKGGACFDCHEVDAAARPASLDYRIRPVAFPTRYMLHGWFDHRAHQIVQRPGQPRADGAAACASCHGAPASNAATDLLLPDLASCRACHGGETTRPAGRLDLRDVPRFPYGRGHAGHAAPAARARPALGDDRDPGPSAAAAGRRGGR